jgi:hypothetical protein
MPKRRGSKSGCLRVAVPLLLTLIVSSLPSGAFLPSLEETFAGDAFALWCTGLSSLNESLGDAGYPSISPDLIMMGNTRVFGSAGGPRAGYTCLSGETAAYGAERSSSLCVSWTAGFVEWTIPTSPDRSIGAALAVGAGNVSLALLEPVPAWFDEAIRIPFRSELSWPLFVVEPSVVAYQVMMPGVRLRLRAGYALAWTGECSTTGIPLDEASLVCDGFSVGVAVVIDFAELADDLAETLGLDLDGLLGEEEDDDEGPPTP